MRKQVATLLTVVFLVSLSLTANAAVKQGTTCKKLGLTSISSGKKYTCIRSGKKLVWDKGVLVTKASPSPSPSSTLPITSPTTPTFTPTPTPTPTASTSPSPAPTGPSQPITLDNLDPDWTSIVAYSKVREFAKSQQLPNVQSNLILSPTVTERPYKQYIQGLEDIEKVLYPIFKNPKYSIVLFTEQDSEWIDQTQTRLMGNYLNNPTQQLQSYRIKQNGCNVGGFYLPNIILFCVKQQSELDKLPTSSYSAAHAFPHEFFHLTQFTSTDFTSFPVLGTSTLAEKRFRSCWMDEGFATFYGFALGGSQIDPSGNSRLAFLNELTYSYDMHRNQPVGSIKKLLMQNDAKIVTSLYREVEPTIDSCTEVQNAYVFGELAAEALVASFGYESMTQFYLSVGQSGDWKTSFEKVFGLKVEDFYIKLTPYLASQAKKFP